MLKKRHGGFTLIELLVVISIISLLSAIVMVALNGARLKARDTRRAQDLREIQKALEMYYHDHGSYPASAETCTTKDWPVAFKTALAPYIPSVPIDPNNINATCSPSPASNYYYFFNPITWVSTPKCSSANTPPTIGLMSMGELGGRRSMDECGYGGGVLQRNTIILNR